jgi:hypothetical protein
MPIFLKATGVQKPNPIGLRNFESCESGHKRVSKMPLVLEVSESYCGYFFGDFVLKFPVAFRELLVLVLAAFRNSSVTPLVSVRKIKIIRKL